MPPLNNYHVCLVYTKVHSLSCSQPFLTTELESCIYCSAVGAWADLAVLTAHKSAASNFGNATYSNNFGILDIDASYDYVILGGGTAGLVIAYRFAENQNLTVAVVEAGGFYEQENGNQSLVPGSYTPNIAGPLTN
ncbi:hypothetical protein B0J14DRAFT_649118 [Halenospora varia]|nr:hypothetical protein B0J14DRAFT_649118 [Halenospora varia]